MSIDCTAEPPGELIWMATALAPRMEKALSMAEALVDRARPGRSGVTTPIGPLNLRTGTRGARLVRKSGRQSFQPSLPGTPILSKRLMGVPYSHKGSNQG